MLKNIFFYGDAVSVAKQLLGKMIRIKHASTWLEALIIETEAYYLKDKASHASLGFTQKRKALFMKPGTIYMYYARGGDSLNISTQGDGNAVLIKSAIPYHKNDQFNKMVKRMQTINPINPSGKLRPIHRLCSGQTILCKSLGIKVNDWDQKEFNLDRFHIKDIYYRPKKIIQTARLGIPTGRDEHLPYRFIDHQYAESATKNPLTQRNSQFGKDYFILEDDEN